MRLSFLAILFTCISTSTFAQLGDNYIELSHNITTESKDITGFDKIDVSSDFEVFIKFTDGVEKVEIEANENLHDLIKVERKGSTLIIDTKSYSTSSKGENKAKEKLVAYITAKNLTNIKGDEDVVIVLEDKLRTDKLTINLDEDCTLKGFVEVRELVVDLNEDSVLELEGSTQTMEVTADEDSMIGGYDFVVGNLQIELKEDSEAKLTVNGDIDLEAGGDSYFHYRGDASFTRKRLRGDSEVRHR